MAHQFQLALKYKFLEINGDNPLYSDIKNLEKACKDLVSHINKSNKIKFTGLFYKE